MNANTAQTTVPTGQTPASGKRRPRRDVDIWSLLLEGRAFVALIVLIIIFALLSDSFLTFGNLITMTKHVAYNAILALGMLYVILKGGIDLSVGSIVGLSGVVAGTLLQGWQLTVFDAVAVPAGLARRARLAGGRHFRRLDQRNPGHPVQRRAVHRDARHALHRARRSPADLERNDVPTPRRHRGARKPGLPRDRRRADHRHPQRHLDHGRLRGDRRPRAALHRRSAGGSTRRAATSARPRSPAYPCAR